MPMLRRCNVSHSFASVAEVNSVLYTSATIFSFLFYARNNLFEAAVVQLPPYLLREQAKKHGIHDALSRVSNTLKEVN